MDVKHHFGTIYLPLDQIRREELELAVTIFDEFDYSFEESTETNKPTEVIELCQTLFKLYRKTYSEGRMTYQNEKVLLFGKDGHQSSLSSVCALFRFWVLLSVFFFFPLSSDSFFSFVSVLGFFLCPFRKRNQIFFPFFFFVFSSFFCLFFLFFIIPDHSLVEMAQRRLTTCNGRLKKLQQSNN